MDVDLFLGVRLSHSLETALAKRLEAVSYHFSDSLQIIQQGGNQYFGKLIRQKLSVEELDSQEKHVISLIKKVLPDFNARQTP